jgi:hypothetical protein
VDPLVSSDIVGDPRAAVIDLELTTVVDGTLVKVMAWYDNEWGFTHQMIREARSILGVLVMSSSLSSYLTAPSDAEDHQRLSATTRAGPAPA